jgi:protein-S-isoprenylcysteine O-methyltransferase Ste14
LQATAVSRDYWGRALRRFWASLGSLVFFILAPGTIEGFVPWWLTGWRIGPPFFGIEPLRWVGAALIVLGLLPLLSSFARFAWAGLGTPAPIAPPTNLVVTGFYRRARNPIYVALLIVLLGQALLFGDERVAAWGVLFWLFTFAVVVLFEEPALRHQFGEEYRTYCTNVPRWVPRVIPYKLSP